jgi:hypothetical protein
MRKSRRSCERAVLSAGDGKAEEGRRGTAASTDENAASVRDERRAACNLLDFLIWASPVTWSHEQRRRKRLGDT